jgi:hypothetical protein
MKPDEAFAIHIFRDSSQINSSRERFLLAQFIYDWNGHAIIQV